MGSMIHLSIGNLDIDWGKNTSFADHSPLFQLSDLTDIPYWFVKDADKIDSDNWVLFADYQEGFESPLWKVIDRLQLLGYTLANSRIQYNNRLLGYSEIEESEDQIQFEDLMIAVSKINTGMLMDDQVNIERRLDELFNKQIYDLLPNPKKAEPFYMEFFDDDSPFGLDGYSKLNLLALNPTAQHIPVRWGFNEVIENGWALRDRIVKPLEKHHKFLLVTEGTSDAGIIKHAFKILKPHISDFFDYVDMNEGYPFTGTGSLINFVKGLISIGIQNNVIVIFDNDAEGVASYKKCLALNVPENMRILKLPDLKEFESVETIGPNGQAKADINGKGAAIECYLDLGQTPLVRWSNYNNAEQTYQGALVAKDQYKMNFFKQKEKLNNYDYSKVETVLNTIISDCINMKEKGIKTVLENVINDF